MSKTTMLTLALLFVACVVPIAAQSREEPRQYPLPPPDDLKQCPDGRRVDADAQCPMRNCGGGLWVKVGESCAARTCPSGALVPPGEPCPQTSSLPTFYRGPKPRNAVYLAPPPPGDEPWIDSRPGRRVRVGVHDDGVDIAHPAFKERIGRGGSPAYWHASRRDARLDLSRWLTWDCSPYFGEKCHVWVVDGENSQTTLEGHITRAIAYTRKLRDGGRWFGGPQDYSNDKFWVYDTRADRWYELPPFEGWRPADHGTAVASVVAREAPEASIVPFALNFGAGEFNYYRAWGPGDWPAILLDTDIPWSWDNPRETAERDRSYAQIQAAGWRSVDIMNASYGYSDVISSWSAYDSIEYWRERSHIARMKSTFPRWWRAFTQSDRNPDERTITVYANGNGRWFEGTGEETFNPLARLPVLFPELRGHTIAAAALNAEGTHLAEWADVCGSAPVDWDRAKHGRHWCITAPGSDVPVAQPGGDSDADRTANGSSFAAPYVSGVLAAMMHRFRGQVGNTELAKRMMDTADRSGIFGNEEWFGAGVVDKAAALSPVGVPRVEGHALARTRLTLPAAYGDAARRLDGAEIASFDDGRFPFWRPLHTLVSNARLDPPMLPVFHDETSDPLCESALSIAPEALCASSGRSVRMLAATGRMGAAYSLSDGFSVSSLVRADEGRIDGVASGAFSFGLGASVIAVNTRHERELGPNWRLSTRATVAVDTPGAGARMFETTPALLSSWGTALVRRTETMKGVNSLRFSIDQPLRAETGRATLTVPSGRTTAGETTYGHHAFDLSPSRRELRFTTSYQRPLPVGETLVRATVAVSPGHSPGAPEMLVGAAWRWRF